MTIIRVTRGLRPQGAGSISTKVLTDTLGVSDVGGKFLRRTRVSTDMLTLVDQAVRVSNGAPFVLFHANTAGPRTGGENSNGTYVFLYVLNPPAFSDLGTTASITIGGQAVAGYCHVADPNAPRLAAMGVKRIAFQVGALTGLSDGTAYQITLTTANGTSNANDMFGEAITFTPQPGTIVFVDETNGTDGAAGTKAAPIKRLQNTAMTVGAFRSNGSGASDTSGELGTPPGSHVVLRNGTYTLAGYDGRWANFFQITGRPATGASNRGPIVMMSYPGAPGSNSPELATYQASSANAGLFGNDSTRANHAITSYGGGGSRGWAQYMEFCNVKIISGTNTGTDGSPVNTACRPQFWRCIDMDVSWPQTGQGFSAGFEGSPQNCRFYGNHIHDISSNNSVEDDTNHAFYWDGYGTGTTTAGACATGNIAAFNDIHDITAGCGFNVFDNANGAGLTNNTIAFNWIKTVSKHAINIADTTKSCTAYNNIIEEAGQNAIRISTSDLTATNGILVYNNTIYGWARVTASGASGAALSNESDYSGSARFENNIVCQKASHSANGYYFQNDASSGTLTLAKNQWYDPDGRLTTKPSGDSTGAYGNPQFTNASGADFTLANGSPCIDAGNTPTSTRAYGFGLNTAPQGASHDRGAFERAA